MSKKEHKEPVDHELDEAFDAAFEEAAEVDEAEQRGESYTPNKKDTEDDSALEDKENNEEDSDDDADDAEDTSGKEDSTASDEDDNKEDTSNDDSGEEAKEYNWEALYKKKELQFKSLEGRINKEKSERERLKRLAAERDAEIRTNPDSYKKPNLGPEVTKELKELYEDFPELKTFESLIDQRLHAITDSVKQEVQQSISPLMQRLADNEVSSHMGAITQAHPDWELIVESGRLDDWQESLPEFQQHSVDLVRKNGTTEQVISMLNAFKSSEFHKPSKKKTKTQETEKKAKSSYDKPAVSDALIEQLKAALAVQSSGASVPEHKKSVDKDDFDGAFDEALSAWKD